MVSDKTPWIPKNKYFPQFYQAYDHRQFGIRHEPRDELGLLGGGSWAAVADFSLALVEQPYRPQAGLLHKPSAPLCFVDDVGTF